MEGYKCDLCGNFYAKPVKPDTIFELMYSDITSYTDNTKQICNECLDSIKEYINTLEK